MIGNILLIEDDAFFQKYYHTKLTDSGYNVESATNGKWGLEKMREGAYDLILLDLVMPEIDGFGVLKARAKDKGLRNIPVVVFSTLGQEKDVEEAKKLGANDYMNKTFDNIDELLKKIKKLMET